MIKIIIGIVIKIMEIVVIIVMIIAPILSIADRNFGYFFGQIFTKTEHVEIQWFLVFYEKSYVSGR